MKDLFSFWWLVYSCTFRFVWFFFFALKTTNLTWQFPAASQSQPIHWGERPPWTSPWCMSVAREGTPLHKELTSRLTTVNCCWSKSCGKDKQWRQLGSQNSAWCRFNKAGPRASLLLISSSVMMTQQNSMKFHHRVDRIYLTWVYTGQSVKSAYMRYAQKQKDTEHKLYWESFKNKTLSRPRVLSWDPAGWTEGWVETGQGHRWEDSLHKQSNLVRVRISPPVQPNPRDDQRITKGKADRRLKSCITRPLDWQQKVWTPLQINEIYITIQQTTYIKCI